MELIFSRGVEAGLYTKYKILEHAADKLVFRIYDSAVAHDNSADHPTCHLVAGRMAGALSALSKEEFDCRELTCRAMGNPYCEFVAWRRGRW